MAKSFVAERRGFVEDKARPIDLKVVVSAPRNTSRARQERRIPDERDRPERRMQFRKGGEVKQLANKSINYSAFAIATLIPTVWLLSANLLHFVLSGQLFLSSYRLAAVATGVVWGCIVAWATNVPQVLYFYRPGGRNKNQRRLFVMSAVGLFVSTSALVILGVAQVSTIEDDPVLMCVVASLVIIGLLPIILGCARTWRYIFFTDSQGVYIAYTGQVLQPNTLYRTGLTWKTPALEHYLESEENKISRLRFKDGTFELRYGATVSFPETPVAPEECKVDPLAYCEAASQFLLEQLQTQCARFTGMQCMKMLQGMRPVEEYVYVPALEPKGYEIPIRMRWSGKFTLSDV
ncbi:MAG TPA: hypothetical protein VFV58_32025 [Blastocatellia bacterium]|jgi:hypothetical protein|nr:hypothetical protein [Blastocatellia bacterium]